MLQLEVCGILFARRVSNVVWNKRLDAELLVLLGPGCEPFGRHESSDAILLIFVRWGLVCGFGRSMNASERRLCRHGFDNKRPAVKENKLFVVE